MKENRWSTSDGVVAFKHHAGVGCTSRRDGLPDHNPTPSTERGKRRHNKRNESDKNRAERAWNTGRTIRESRYQKALGKI